MEVDLLKSLQHSLSLSQLEEGLDLMMYEHETYRDIPCS
jgi:hypothetical protein